MVIELLVWFLNCWVIIELTKRKNQSEAKKKKEIKEKENELREKEEELEQKERKKDI